MSNPRKDGGLPPADMSVRTLHEGWLRLHLVTMTGPDGGTFERYVEDHGRAAMVLPYNPRTRMALLVTMPRAALRYAGADDLLEAPAGMIDPGETAAQTALRELMEEAGLSVEALEPAGAVFATPGVSTERADLFLAAYDDANRTGAGGGLASENEHITVVEVPLVDLWAMVDSGVSDAKTRVLVQTLRIRRPELFG
ncbi:MAG: NUDIX domain-containing protein [Pseudomonadota bacterium]